MYRKGGTMTKSIIILTMVSVFMLFTASQIALAADTAEEAKNIGIMKKIIEEGYNKGNLKVTDEFLGADYKHYWGNVLDKTTGPGALKKSITSNRKSYEFKVEIVDIFANGNKVVLTWHYKGTHKKSGNHVSFYGVLMAVFENGKALEGKQYYDSWTVYKQLGYTLTPPAWAEPKKTR